MRNAIVLPFVLAFTIASASAQVSVAIGVPGVNVGINMPVYPQLVRVPGYPVYYAPQASANYFFYDGMYWVYDRDNWYASSWYNGPWHVVSPDAVPVYVLRVPVRYYQRPPAYFSSWSSNAAPRWDEHWGSSWEQSHRGWNSGNRGAVPQAAPLPVYQRQYSGNRYPPPQQQQVLQAQSYRYQPRDVVVQQHYQAQQMRAAPVPNAQGNPSKYEQKQAKQEQKAQKQAQHDQMEAQKQAQHDQMEAQKKAQHDQKEAKRHDGPKGDKP